MLYNVYLYTGEANPNNVKLRNPSSANTYVYIGSGAIVLTGAAACHFTPATNVGAGITWKPGRKRKKVAQPVIYKYFATGRIAFSGTAAARFTPAIWEEVVEAAWPTIVVEVQRGPRTILVQGLEGVLVTDRSMDDDEILLMLEALDV